MGEEQLLKIDRDFAIEFMKED